MKLYSYVHNERGIGKGQGGQKSLSMKLLHETKYGTWQTLPRNINEINIWFEWLNGEPNLVISLPEAWMTMPDMCEFGKGGQLRAKYSKELDTFTYPKG